MHLTTLRSVGGSVMLAIPKSLLEGLNLAANTKVGLSVEQGRLVVEPRHKPRYFLAELMAHCDVTAPMSEEEQAWDTIAPVGRESF